MKKTTITYTTLPARALGTAGTDGMLRLSLFIAPRLWTDDPQEETQVLPLGDYPVFADWPQRVHALKFAARFDGGETQTLDAIVRSAGELRSDIWGALFPPETPVKPFRFDNLAEIPIQTIDSAFLEDWLRELYRRVGTEGGYGLGADKPSAEAMQNDPGIRAIARPSEPEPSFQVPPKTHIPVDYSPTGEEEPQGCMYWLITLLRWLVGILNFIAGGLGLGAPFKLPGAPPQAAAPGQAPGTRSVPLSTGVDAKQPPGACGPQPQTFAATRGLAGPAREAGEEFDKLNVFLQPFKKYKRIEDIPPKLTDEQLANLLDFHDGVALAGDYPTLLRALGLVVDVDVDWPADLPATGTVSIGAGPIDGAVTHVLRTHYRLVGNRFLAESRQVHRPETSDGLLRLSDEQRYRIVQADVVGASVKVQNAATAIAAQNVPGLQPANPPAMETLPALRSAGLSVVQRDLALQLSFTYAYAAGLQNRLALIDGSAAVSPGSGSAPPEPTDEVWEDDLIRGYRMDVCDLDSASKQWRSLHQRVGECRFHRSDPPITFDVVDEGFEQIATTGPPAEGAAAVQRVADTITTWTGWSLSVERPGKALIETEDGENPAQQVTNGDENAKTAFKMTTIFAPVPASLPRLRFGHRYQVRVRTVDLAGNSVFGPQDAEFQEAHEDDTPPRPYQRYEPVPSPAVVLKERPLEGESVEHLVIRSSEDPDDPYAVDRPITERHIVPPKASQLMAEHHGLFDAADGKPNASPATYELAAREANTLSHHWVPVPNVDGLVKVPIKGIQTLSGTDGDEQQEPIFWQTGDAFPLKYLPDPLSRQAVFRNLPGPAENIATSIPFGSKWPECLPFRLRLCAIATGQQPKEPRWLADDAADAQDPRGRILEVQLPPGERRIVRLNSGTETSDLPQMGIWTWETEPPSDQHQIVASNTVQGMNWLLMPYRDLDLVHATQRPLKMPKLSIEEVSKQEGDTAVVIDGRSEVHGKTTGKVDLLGFWTDPIDDPVKDEPSERSSRAAIGETKVGSPDAASVDIHMTHNFGDTKYHRVIYAARGSSRFREYMPGALLKAENAGDLLSRPTEAEIQGKIAAGELDTLAVVRVLNSSRPQAPVIAYVMPTMGRVVEHMSISGGESIITRVRRGNGLRVFLKRPWYSSGAGELLGVALQAQGDQEPMPSELQPYVTEWANDPIWNAQTAPLVARPSNFRKTAAGPLQVKLEETDQSVMVLGFSVEFDRARGLWFADIELTGLDSYMPMVRLALARFQPQSVGDAFISRIVRADFIQPLPDRTLTVRRPANSLGPLTVTLAGIEPNVTGAKPRVQAWIEVLAQPGQGELGWEKMTIAPQVSTAPGDLWRGTFDLATGSLQSGRRYRLVIQEIEPLAAAPDAHTADARLGRTVYADTWEIPAQD